MLIVQKYGGTSVADADRIRNVARRALVARKAGHDVVVVVSAMAGETNRLLKLTSDISKRPSQREQDVVVSTGEQVTVGLLALAIQEMKGRSRSFLGHQVRILTDSAFANARIRSIDDSNLRESLRKKEIAVVAGFQGIDEHGNITTLGRGGSDTTAVALAAALKAEACEIYTDVDGVYSADPRIVPAAKRLTAVSYEEMLEMAATGGRVLALRSVEFARNHGVVLHVRSSFTWERGTWVNEEGSLEQAIVSGVTHDTSEAKVTVAEVPDQPGIAARLFGALAKDEVNVDMIVQNTSTGGTTDISFTVPRADLVAAMRVSESLAPQIGAKSVTNDAEIGRVSIVGAGMKTHPGVAARMFEILADEGVNIEMISTSSIRISCVVRARDVERAVRALHTAFELDQAPVA